ncbi:hypothetical protein BDW74DRAFT_143226 [Aspergillus multicolor]|uniref:nuclear telomere cap complex subunit Ten1 n=1 Tax=Aspergillus multicolor TaxID=41759 RepID=UPI003CCCF006
MNGPLPSSRAFLSDIPSLPADCKVRFLGCVKTYNISTGRLVLEHDYPRTKKPKRPKQDPPAIYVKVDTVLETVTWEELCVGAWVNVIGYVRRTPEVSMGESAPPESVQVDAVVLFPAGAIDLGEYEQILSDLLQVERMGREIE